MPWATLQLSCVNANQIQGNPAARRQIWGRSNRFVSAFTKLSGFNCEIKKNQMEEIAKQSFHEKGYNLLQYLKNNIEIITETHNEQ